MPRSAGCGSSTSRLQTDCSCRHPALPRRSQKRNSQRRLRYPFALTRTEHLAARSLFPTPPMNHSAIALTALVALAGVASAASQTSPAATPPEPTQLSPFIIDVSRDTGYAATQTLAGTRLRTDLKDTPVSLSILTEDFLNDIAATGLESVVDFLPNTAMFTVSGGDDSGNASKVGDTLNVRGFKTASATRNFFQSLGFNDRYITNRLTFSRGPNALLFGVGNPGGAVHVATNRAEFGRNRGGASYQWDNYDSHRLTLDQNYVLVPKRLAVRGDLLYQYSHGFREPTFDRKDGAFFTTTWNPFDQVGKTQVRLNYEHGKWNRVTARPWAPFDLFSTWVNAGTPLYDNRTAARPPTVPTRASPFTLFEDSIVSILGQNALPAFRTVRATGYNSYVRSAGPIANGAEQTGSSITRDFTAVNPLAVLLKHFGGDQARLNTWLGSLGQLRSIPDLWAGGKTHTVPMETFFSGNHDRYVRQFHAVSPFVEHQFGRNLFVEVAANFERADVDNLTMMRATDYGIQYDPNLYLPGGAPNPYAAMPYVGSNVFATHDISTEKTREYRATATYLLDLKKYRVFQALDLGRHSLSALGNRYEDETLSQQNRPAVTEWGGLPIERIVGAGVRAGTANIRGRYYLLPGTVPYLPEPWVPLKGEGTVGKSDWINFNGGFTRTKIDSLALSTQSFFWRDRLVLTGGWRRDHLIQHATTQQTVPAAGAAPAQGSYFNEVDLAATLRTLALKSERTWNNRSVGAVLHVNRFVSVFYNTATNVSGGDDQYDIFYQPVSTNNGRGVDYGIKFQLLGTKLVGSLTQFETTQTNTFVNSGFLFGRGAITNAVNAILTILDPAEFSRRSALPAWVPIYDSQTKGRELEVVCNPTRGLRLRGTFSTQENLISRFAEDIDAYLASNRPAWDAFATANYDPNFRGAVVPNSPTAAERRKLDADTIRTSLQAINQEMPLKRGLNGVPTLGLPRYALSFAGTYDFSRESLLGGWSVGTTVRYRGTTAVAFEQDAAGVSNLNHALRAPGGRDWDMHVTYRRKLFRNRIDWRLQANVRNLLDDHDPLFLTGQWDRTSQVFLYTRNQMKEPRSLILTSTFGW